MAERARTCRTCSRRSRARPASASAAAWAPARAATRAAGSRARSRAPARTPCAPASRAARCRSRCAPRSCAATPPRDAMPIGPFRTYTQPVNIRDLDRFEAGEEVTPETLKAKGLIRSIRKDVKLLGVGELTKKLTITVHARLGDRAREGRGGRRHADAAQGAEGQRKPKNAQAPAREAAAEGARGGAERRGRRRRGARARQCCPGSPTPGGFRSCGAGCCSRPGSSPPTGSARGCPRRASTPPRSRTSSTAGGSLLGLLNLFSRLGALALLDLRARDHAVRHGLDHPAALTVVDPEARAAAEGGRGGLRQDQPVHPLPHRRARGRAGGRLRVPLPHAGRAAARTRAASC